MPKEGEYRKGQQFCALRLQNTPCHDVCKKQQETAVNTIDVGLCSRGEAAPENVCSSATEIGAYPCCTPEFPAN